MKKFTMFALAAVLLAACGKNKTSDLTLGISGLEDLGSDYAYEGWIIVDGEAITTGVFNVDANGNLSTTTFEVNKKELEDASEFVLTIEPSPDSDPGPSAVHILAGSFSGGTASLTVSSSSALGTDFGSSTGSYILATPTDGSGNNENSGVWWLDPSAGPGASLSLPTLPDGWVYEGWAVIGGTPVSTGTFTAVDAADDAAPYSGTMAGPSFPGEDFLVNAPSGLTFPTDLAGGTAVISVEPNPDNSPNPFLLKPLVGDIPSGAVDHTSYSMSNNATNTNPVGTATRESK